MDHSNYLPAGNNKGNHNRCLLAFLNSNYNFDENFKVEAFGVAKKKSNKKSLANRNPWNYLIFFGGKLKFSLTVLPDVSQPYGSPEFPNASQSSCSNPYPTVKHQSTDLDPAAAAYNYNNWSNGYNSASGYPQYGCNTQATQYGPVPAPTMLLYPQVYSTVNQNQIHLHLHGAATDKLEQYLNPDNVMISSLRGGPSGGTNTAVQTTSTAVVEVESPAAQLGLITETEAADVAGDVQENRDDPNNVWRPY